MSNLLTVEVRGATTGDDLIAIDVVNTAKCVASVKDFRYAAHEGRMYVFVVWILMGMWVTLWEFIGV